MSYLTAADLAPYGYPVNGSDMPAPKSYNALLRVRAINVRWLAVYATDNAYDVEMIKLVKCTIKKLDKKIAKF